MINYCKIFIYIFISFLIINCERIIEIRIESDPSNATFLYKNEEYTTPSVLQISQNEKNEIQLNKEGYLSKLITINAEKDYYKLVLEPIVKSVIFDVKPNYANIEYNKKRYSSDQEIQLINNEIQTFKVSVSDYETKKIEIQQSDISNKMEITLQRKTFSFTVKPYKSKIEYNGLIYGLYDSIPIDKNLKFHTFTVSYNGYETYKFTIDNDNFPVFIDPVILRRLDIAEFGNSIVDNIKLRDSLAIKEIINPYNEEILEYNLFSNTELNFEQLKLVELNRIARELYRENNWEDLIFLLSQGLSGFYFTPEEPSTESFLSKSIEKDDSILLKRLIESGAEINRNYWLGITHPDITDAIRNKSYNCLEELLELGYNPNEAIESSNMASHSIKYPIFEAISDSKAMGILLEYGAKTDVMNIDEIVKSDSVEITQSVIVEKYGKYIREDSIRKIGLDEWENLYNMQLK